MAPFAKPLKPRTIISPRTGIRHKLIRKGILWEWKAAVFITTKDLNWKNFNIVTIVLYKKIDFLLKLKEVANEYVKQRGWEKAGFYFHCFPHNSVNSLHLHVVNEDAKYIGHMHEEFKYKNLPLDVAIKVAKSL